MWNPAHQALNLTPAQVQGAWPHRCVLSSGDVPCLQEAVDAATEIYGGNQSITARLLLSTSVNGPVIHTLGQLDQLRGAMEKQRHQKSVSFDRDEKRESRYVHMIEHNQKTTDKNQRKPPRVSPQETRKYYSRSSPPPAHTSYSPPQRTPLERAMFGFLLEKSGLSKEQLRALRDEGQRTLARALGFVEKTKPKNE